MTHTSEAYLVILPSAGWLLWTWGGLNYRPARWVLWPLVAGACVWIALNRWRAVGLAASMAATLSAGYGPKSRLHWLIKRAWLVEVIAGLLYGLSLVWIGWNFWIAAVIVYVPLAFRCSRQWLPSWTHKYVEGFAGLFQGLAIAKRLSGV